VNIKYCSVILINLHISEISHPPIGCFSSNSLIILEASLIRTVTKQKVFMQFILSFLHVFWVQINYLLWSLFAFCVLFLSFQGPSRSLEPRNLFCIRPYILTELVPHHLQALQQLSLCYEVRISSLVDLFRKRIIIILISIIVVIVIISNCWYIKSNVFNLFLTVILLNETWFQIKLCHRFRWLSEFLFA
jgi:hypothetical protein